MTRLFPTNLRTSQALVRITLGGVMFAHGAQKMLGWWGGMGFHGTMNMFEHMSIPPVFAFLAICAEFFGGLGLIFGLFSRLAAFGVLCNMVMAIALVHGKNGFFMTSPGQQGIGFEYHILAIAMALAVIIGGAGACAFDHLIGTGVARTERPVEYRELETRQHQPYLG